jgi:hypothetical protein
MPEEIIERDGRLYRVRKRETPPPSEAPPKKKGGYWTSGEGEHWLSDWVE